MEDDEGIVNYEYNAADMLLKTGDAQYEYDKSGNKVTKLDDGRVTEYKYDGRDLLVSV
jgi:uncharacterized protein RhaS with RHS repeats